MFDSASARERMVASQLHARGISDARVLQAMLHVPRDQFVAEEYRSKAYDDHPLPIGDGQTISQPYIVALMLESLQLKPTDKILEVGTGSGYATALLAELVSHVYSIERHAELAAKAQQMIESLGYTNVTIVTGDGSLGLPPAAPFEAILVSASAAHIPSALIGQLAEGGRMIIPVGTDDSQQLQFVRKIHGEAIVSPRELVRFVPLISEREQ
jgi:protein-L-isoaspartate(D-aspartate) O-methyltransferase